MVIINRSVKISVDKRKTRAENKYICFQSGVLLSLGNSTANRGITTVLTVLTNNRVSIAKEIRGVGTGDQGSNDPPGNLPGVKHGILTPDFLERNIFWYYTGLFILSKIINTVATSCQISRLKCTKFDLSQTVPRWEAYSAPADTLAQTSWI